MYLLIRAPFATSLKVGFLSPDRHPTLDKAPRYPRDSLNSACTTTRIYHDELSLTYLL
jgi:hypothetical protein